MLNMLCNTPLEIYQDNLTNRSRWLGNAGEDVIDENRFYNCVSPFSSSVSKRMLNKYYCRS